MSGRVRGCASTPGTITSAAMPRYSGAAWWTPAAAAVGLTLVAGCGATPGPDTKDGRFVGSYVLTIAPSAECRLPSPLVISVKAAMLQAAGPGNRLEVTLRPRLTSGIYAMTVDLLYDKMALRGGMSAGKEGQCAKPEEECGVATSAASPYRVHLEGIAEGAVEATATGGRVAAGTMNGDILLSRPGDALPDTQGACSSDTHRWTLEPEVTS